MDEWSHPPPSPSPTPSLPPSSVFPPHYNNWIFNVINRSLINQCTNVSDPSSSFFPFFSSPKSLLYYGRQRVVLEIYVVSALCLIGFIGNALTVVVLSRTRGKATSTDWLLQTLAVVDTVYLVSCLFVQTLKAINDMTDWMPGLSSHFPYVEQYVWPVASIAQTLTVWTVLLVTVDRYVAVCKPFSTHLRSLSRVKLVVAAVIIAAIAFNVPQFFERKISHETQPCSGKVMVKITMTSLRHSVLYFVIYKIICYLIFRSVGPLVTLLVLNVLLIQTLRRNHRKHRGVTGGVSTAAAAAAASNHRSKNRENITLMLIVVVSVFIVCQLPDVCLRLAINQASNLPTNNDKDFYRSVNAITNVMLTLNSSINFLIYCLVGKKFRRIFVQTFLGSSCAPRSGSMSEVSESQPQIASAAPFRELAITVTSSKCNEAHGGVGICERD